MFDILCSVWKKPGASHSPILPLDISRLTAENAEAEISRLHKYGLDTIYLINRSETVSEDTLDSLFAAAAKRYMLVFVDEDVIAKYTSCTDEAFISYNPMMKAHTLRLSKCDETKLSLFEEITDSLYLKSCDGVFSEAVFSVEDDADGFEKYDVILTPVEQRADVLSEEFGEMFLYGAYENFYSRFGETYKGTFTGVVSSRTAKCTTDKMLWSYDMTKEFFTLGGKPIELVSLIASTDKRSRKEGERIYCKTLSSRLDKTYLSPVSAWCGKKSLAFAGEVPYEFCATASRRFTLPIYNDDQFKVHERDGKDKLIALRALSDTSRSEGFTGAVYRMEALDGAGVIKEAAYAASAGASLVLLDEKFGDSEYLASVGLRAEDMKRLTCRLRRLSTLGTSCKPDVSCAVLYDDGYIPFAASKKLVALGVQFSFLPVSQALDRGHNHNGEFLVDKFRYSSVLIDPRVRLEPFQIKHIGEFAVYGGQMYRGGAFGDFAKKHLVVNDEMKENAKSFVSYSTFKSGVLFKYFVNKSGETSRLTLSDIHGESIFRFDSVTGERVTLPVIDGKINIRVLPDEDVVLVFESSDSEFDEKLYDTLCEVHSIKNGENVIDIHFSEDRRAIIEIDAIDGFTADFVINGNEIPRIVASPLKADVTPYIHNGENRVLVTSDGKLVGCVLRITC